jgi:hypothetical protein
LAQQPTWREARGTDNAEAATTAHAYSKRNLLSVSLLFVCSLSLSVSLTFFSLFFGLLHDVFPLLSAAELLFGFPFWFAVSRAWLDCDFSISTSKRLLVSDTQVCGTSTLLEILSANSFVYLP